MFEDPISDESLDERIEVFVQTAHVHKAISIVVAAQEATSKDGRGVKGGRSSTPLEAVVWRLRGLE